MHFVYHSAKFISVSILYLCAKHIISDLCGREYAADADNIMTRLDTTCHTISMLEKCNSKRQVYHSTTYLLVLSNYDSNQNLPLQLVAEFDLYFK